MTALPYIIQLSTVFSQANAEPLDFNIVNEFPSLTIAQSTDSGSSQSKNNNDMKRRQNSAISIGIGSLMNDPMVGGNGLTLSYYQSLGSRIGLMGSAKYVPDMGLNDIKNLTTTLVTIAYQGSNSSSFQQPLDKLELNTFVGGYYNAFSATQSGTTGNIKIFGGIGFLSSNGYFAQYDSSIDPSVGLPVSLVPQGRSIRYNLNVGSALEIDLDAANSLMFKYDCALYYGSKPQYDPSVPVTESRVYNKGFFSIEYMRRL